MKNMLTKKGIKIMINELDYWTQRVLDSADLYGKSISEKKAQEIASNLMDDDFIQQSIDDFISERLIKEK